MSSLQSVFCAQLAHWRTTNWTSILLIKAVLLWRKIKTHPSLLTDALPWEKIKKGSPSIRTSVPLLPSSLPSHSHVLLRRCIMSPWPLCCTSFVDTERSPSAFANHRFLLRDFWCVRVFLELQNNQEAAAWPVRHRAGRQLRTETLDQMGIRAWLATRWKKWSHHLFYWEESNSSLIFLFLPWQSCWVSRAWTGALRDWLLGVSLTDDSPHFPIPFHAHASPPASWEISPEDTRGPHLVCTLFNGAAVNTLRVANELPVAGVFITGIRYMTRHMAAGEANGNRSSLWRD